MSSADRVVGLDVARGLAVLGMFTAHVGGAADDFWSGNGWLQIADGRSAAGFATLAGVSAALLSGGRVPRASLRRDRARIVARALIIGLIGVIMVALGTPIAVILPTYALLFMALTPVLRWSRRALVAAASLVVLVGPPLLMAARDDGRADSLLGVLVLGEHYPALVWIAYLLVGLAVGRSDLRSGQVRRTLAAVGGVCVVLGYGTAAVAMRVATSADALRLLTSRPQSDTGPEVVGNIGVVLLVLVLCLVLADRVPRLVLPVAATGALALTSYCGHLIAIAVLGPEVVYHPGPLTLPTFILVTLALTTAWRLTVGRGPLEGVVHAVSDAVGDMVAPRTPEPVPEDRVTPGRAAPRAGS